MWDVFEEVERMHKEMDRLFDRMVGSHKSLIGYNKGSSKEVAKWHQGFRPPVVDVKETEKGILAVVEIPGADKKDIDLNVTDNSIEVKVEKKDEKKVEKKGNYSYSSVASSFYRRIPLPAEIESSKANASYRNGILRIEAPKRNRVENKSHRISIE